MTFVEPDFWDWRVDPTRHALERFVERAAPPALDDAYLRWALRDLAIAEGWLSDRPPDWTGLADSAPFYVVIARFLCLPMHGHRSEPGRFEPSTVVSAADWLVWNEALEAGYVHLPPPPPRPLGHLPTTPSAPLAERFGAWLGGLGQPTSTPQSVVPSPPPVAVPPLPPRPGGLPVTPQRWRAWHSWRNERDQQRTHIARAQQARARAHMDRIARAQAAERDRLQRWERELLPAYQQTWVNVYHQTRNAGPRDGSGPPASDAGSWHRALPPERGVEAAAEAWRQRHCG